MVDIIGKLTVDSKGNMMTKKTLLIILGSALAITSYADNNNKALLSALTESTPISATKKTVANPNLKPITIVTPASAAVKSNNVAGESLVNSRPQQPAQVTSANPLVGGDSDAVTYNKLKRQIEIQAMQKKLDNPSNQNTGQVPPITNVAPIANTLPKVASQTVVTGVFSYDGNTIANLLFADGSSLEVQKGSRFEANDKTYVVSSISTSGVVASEYSKTGKVVKSIKMSRAYARPIQPLGGGGINTQPTYNAAPTQTITDGNMRGSVPPIQPMNGSSVQNPFLNN